MIRKTLVSILLAVPFAASSAQALTASQIVEREIIVRNPDGTQTIKREKADLVTPGDKVVYSLHYVNDQDQIAENVVLSMPIPPEITYIEGSAQSEGTRTLFSVDGGKTYAPRSDLMVWENGQARAARASDITNIRWMVGAALAPKQTGRLSYAGRLK